MTTTERLESKRTAMEKIVPPYWPCRTPPPDKALWIPWPIALVLMPGYWLLPHRLGPHYARLSFFAVVAIQLLWTLYGIGFLLLSLDERLFHIVCSISEYYPQPDMDYLTDGDGFRWISGPLYAVGAVTLMLGHSPEGLLLLGGGALGFEVLLVTICVFMIPYAAGGERGHWLLARCVKLALLSSTTLFPLGLLLVAVRIYGWGGDERTSVGLLIGCLWMLFFLRILFLSGGRYAGSAEGPAWEPIPASCCHCGYRLTRLRPDGPCPECGSAVVESLPESRRPTAWADASGGRKPMGYVRSLLGVLRSGRFVQTLPVRSEYTQARAFAMITTAVALGVWLLLEVLVSRFILQDRAAWTYLHDDTEFLQLILFCILVYPCLLWFNSILVFMGTRCGEHPLRPVATMVFYQSAWLIPLSAAAALSHLLIASLMTGGPSRGIDVLYVLIGLAPTLTVVAFWAGRIIRAGQSARYSPA